ncbi:DUF551 domain-containing protein [Klebsiella pneumoniae]|nr:DUF551 domain-containing protein [Klebsiella pneumoniae]MCQ8734578.1 DUF551 domain-containing protein [Klebsiella pneumoniae]
MTSKFSIDNRELLQRISNGEAVVGIDFGNLIVRELAAFRLAAMDSEPVAIIDQANLDYLRSGADADVWPPEREEMGDVLLYRHPQPAPVVPVVLDFKKLARELVDNLVDCGGLDEGVKEKYLEWAEKTCRAAMLAAATQSPGSEPATVPGKWIPVSERMPIEFEAVIAFDGDQVYGEAMYSSDDGFTIDGYEPCDRLNLQNVTHWMPLPSAPQEAK